MRDNVKVVADKIAWFDPICSGSEDVRAIWENANLARADNPLESSSSRTKISSKRLLSVNANSMTNQTGSVVNLSCHRLLRNGAGAPGEPQTAESLAIASDARGCLRLFRYPCYDIEQGFYEFRLSLSPVNCCRFLSNTRPGKQQTMFVSTSLDGSICLWSIAR